MLGCVRIFGSATNAGAGTGAGGGTGRGSGRTASGFESFWMNFPIIYGNLSRFHFSTPASSALAYCMDHWLPKRRNISCRAESHVPEITA